MHPSLLPVDRPVSAARFHRAMVARRALRTPEPEPDDAGELANFRLAPVVPAPGDVVVYDSGDRVLVEIAGPWGIDGPVVRRVRRGTRTWRASGAPSGELTDGEVARGYLRLLGRTR